MIFLFRFDVTDKGMDFILNEEIAKDMYPDLEEMLRDLVRYLCSMLKYYKVYNKEKTIFSGFIHDNGKRRLHPVRVLENTLIHIPRIKLSLIMENLLLNFVPQSWIGDQQKSN